MLFGLVGGVRLPFNRALLLLGGVRLPFNCALLLLGGVVATALLIFLAFCGFGVLIECPPL